MISSDFDRDACSIVQLTNYLSEQFVSLTYILIFDLYRAKMDTVLTVIPARVVIQQLITVKAHLTY